MTAAAPVENPDDGNPQSSWRADDLAESNCCTSTRECICPDYCDCMCDGCICEAWGEE